MTTFIKQRARLQALVILIACTATLACVQTPVVPSGANRVPINSDELISQYRERVKSDQREKQERSLLTRHIESLTQQVQELSAALMLMQLHQQELAKGKSKSGLTITKTAQSDEERSTSAGPACSIGPSAAPSPSPPPLMHEEPTDSWKPRVIALSNREQIELHHQSVIFRVSQRFGRSEFRPSKPLQSHLKKVMSRGPCLHIRGYTDGDKDRWIERETAKQRAYKARAYLIAQGVAPDHIQVTIVPIGGHVADNATKQGRAKNRRVEIEVKEHNPATIWPQWYG